MDKFEEVKKLINGWENKAYEIGVVLQSIKELTKKDITETELTNYWRSENLDDFVRRIVVKPLENWQEIDDQKALELINQILLNVSDDSIIAVNGEALEKRYSKPEGTVSDFIFQDDIADADEVLRLLKENTTLLL